MTKDTTEKESAKITQARTMGACPQTAGRNLSAAKTSNDRAFFEQLPADHPECKIKFERNINHQKVSEIIEKIAKGA